MRALIATAVGLVTSAVLFGRANAAPMKARDRLSPGPDPLPHRAPSLAGAGYIPDEANPYGPKHRTRRPPGLPVFIADAIGPAGRVRVDGISEGVTEGLAHRVYAQRYGHRASLVTVTPVRKASARGAAVRPVAEQAHKAGLGEAFVRTLTHLAKTEGEGGTFAVPARNFNAPCTTKVPDRARRCTLVEAPRWGTLITAWGVFQWNRDAGRMLAALDDLGLRAPAMPPDWMPWDWSATEEIAVPIDYYAQLWALVRRRGGSPLDAARGARLWHTGPARFRRYLARGADPRAWVQVEPLYARRIDHHLNGAGVA